MTPEALAALHATCFPDAPWSEDELRATLSLPTSRLLSVDNAFLIASLIPPEAEILSLGVHPDARRNGQAARLIDALKTQADRIFLEVSAGNTAALALYQRHGFAVTGRRKGYYKTREGAQDAVTMSWACAPSPAP